MGRVRRSYRRKKPSRSPDLIVIASEGEKTELQYFSGMKRKCNSSNVRVYPLEREDPTRSSPEDVIQQLDKYKKENKLKSNDRLCMVIDRDEQSWNEELIADVARRCVQKGYLLAVSNPNFELWLMFHHMNNRECEHLRERVIQGHKPDLKVEMRRQLGSYNPSNLDIEQFWGRVEKAINMAAANDDENKRWPELFGSRVYLVVREIFDRGGL